MKKLVIIPTYNERENIREIILAVQDLHENIDILVVDDSSPDGTADIVRLMQNDFPESVHLTVRKKKEGLGKAYLHGFHWALSHDYDLICEMDADFSHNPKDLPRLFAAMQQADVAVGSRYVTGVIVVNCPMCRVLLSYFASKYVKFILGLPVNDTTAGFVCFTRRALQDIGLDKVRLKGYGFQVEMKYRAYVKGLNIVEVPIIFTNREHGESKMHGGIIGEAVFGVLRLRMKQLLGTL